MIPRVNIRGHLEEVVWWRLFTSGRAARPASFACEMALPFSAAESCGGLAARPDAKVTGCADAKIRKTNLQPNSNIEKKFYKMNIKPRKGPQYGKERGKSYL